MRPSHVGRHGSKAQQPPHVCLGGMEPGAPLPGAATTRPPLRCFKEASLAATCSARELL
jgi:hypothetical protein